MAWEVSSARVIHSASSLPSGDPANADNIVVATTTTSDDGGGGNRSLINILESANINYYVFGATGRVWYQPIRSKVEDSVTPGVYEDDVNTITPTSSGLVSYTYTITNGDLSSNDLVGRAKRIEITGTPNNDEVTSNNSHFISRKIAIGDAVGTGDNGTITVEVGSVGSGDDGTLNGVYPIAIFNRDSGESPVALQAYLSYARGTPYANKQVSAIVHTDLHVEEDNQLQVASPTGLISYTYTISESDKATSHIPKSTSGYSELPSGSPKHLLVENGDNTSRDSTDAWGVTKHYWVDIHHEREEPLDKDTWNTADPTDGSENTEEEPFQYVILGDTLNLWAHVMSIRFDREIETWDGDTGTYPANRAIRLSTIQPNGNVKDTLITDTSFDGWTAGNDENESGELNGLAGSVTYEEGYEVFVQGTDTVTINGVTLSKGHRYVLFVANGGDVTPRTVDTVVGFGLDWQLVERQGTSSNEGSLECWVGTGAWIGGSSLTITMSDSCDSLAAFLGEYSGGVAGDTVAEIIVDSAKSEASGGGGNTFTVAGISGTTGEDLMVTAINANDSGGVTFTNPNNERSENPSTAPGHNVSLSIADEIANATNAATGDIDGGNTDWQGISIMLRAGQPDDPNGGQNFNRPWIRETGAMTPASSNWQVQAEIDFEGCSGKANDLITIASPLITAKIMLIAPDVVSPGQAFRVYVQVLDKAIASGETLSTYQPSVPENTPELRGVVVSGVTVVDSVVSRPSDKNGASMNNVIDDTPTVNGTIYYYDVVAPTLPGTEINFTVFAALGGDIVDGTTTKVIEPEFNPLGEIFA